MTSPQLIAIFAVLFVFMFVVIVLWLGGAISTLPTMLTALGGALAAALGGVAAIVAATS
ncbi:hypothetical protein [Dactylosporangium sp. NPDC006015]|uniref:hypothetical protein n=1 Tax=Dactylosporangium sp. NPDC006015 TaxID=3154576 RepID=UPI0033A3844D